MNRMHATKDFWLAALRADGAAFRAAVTEATAEMPVPPCPEWTVSDLVRHVSTVYRWVGTHVNRGVTTAPEFRRAADAAAAQPTPDAPPSWEETLAEWDREYDGLLRLLDTLDPELPAWNPWPQAKKASFWHRRMAHETAVHRWDAQISIASAEPIEAKLAADGVSEVLDSWLPAGRRKGPTDRLGVAQLVSTDAEQVWYVRLRGQGIALLDTSTLFDTDDHHTRVMARGTSSDLLLALMGRIPFDVLEVSGDATLLESLRTG